MQTSSIRIFLLATTCWLFAITDSSAQLLQKSAQKIRSFTNVSYTDIIGFKFQYEQEYSSDTLASYIKPVPSEVQNGGHFLIKSANRSYAFDGNKMVNLSLVDSTYQIETESASGGQNTRTLLHWASVMEKYVKKSKSVKYFADTTVNGMDYFNFQVVAYDTIQNNEHFYTLINFLIDKQTYLPLNIRSEIRGMGSDGTIGGYTESHTFSGYKINEKKFPDLATIVIPDHFKLPTKHEPIPPLPNGTLAPKLTAFNLYGNSLEFEKLKGKIVLINFTLVGCPHCVNAAYMLNNLQAKFKNKGLEILNVYPFDKKEAIEKFDNFQKISTPSYTSLKETKKLYSLDGYPSFYLIDKDGIIVQHHSGYFKELESLLTAKIDTLVK